MRKCLVRKSPCAEMSYAEKSCGDKSYEEKSVRKSLVRKRPRTKKNRAQKHLNLGLISRLQPQHMFDIKYKYVNLEMWMNNGYMSLAVVN